MNKFTAFQLNLFAILGILFIPFPFVLFPFQKLFTAFVFQKFIVFICSTIFNLKLNNYEITSDSVTFYILIFCLFLLAFLITSLLFFFSKKVIENSSNFYSISNRVLSYYLAMQLVKYGIDKVFKTQFYFPEPNILYTEFGSLNRDILYWSTMGTSKLYNNILGGIEIFTACLILFKRTRTVGLILSVGLLVNIVAVNFSFNISVKLYSLFLLFLSLILLKTQLKLLYQFFITNKMVQLPIILEIPFFKNNPFYKSILKTMVVITIFTEALLPYFNNISINNNLVVNHFKGAYKVDSITPKNVIPELNASIKRVFIHSSNYIIFQKNNEVMVDYKFHIDTINKQFYLQDYQLKITKLKYTYHYQDSTLLLQYFENNKDFLLYLKPINWKDLPALKNEFNWTVEGNFID